MRSGFKVIVLILLFSVGLTICGDVFSEDIGVTTGTAYKYRPEGVLEQGTGQRYRIELRDAELKDAIRFLAKVSGVNVMIPEDVTGTVNVSFENISIMDAITTITRANGLDFAVERGVLRVGKSEMFTGTGEDLKTETFRLKYASAKDLPQKISKLLSDRGSVLADERTNSLIVRERLVNIENIRKLIENIDIRDSQVLIEAKIVEVTRDFSRSLGIQWGVNRTGSFNAMGLSAVGLTDDGNRNLNVNLPATSPTSGLSMIVGRVGGASNFDMQITAAEKRGDAHVISEPSIVTSNGVAANIRSGETMYIKTTGDINIGTPGGTSTTGGGQGLQAIETGVELKVTPQISVDEYIKLNIEATTSQPDFTRAVEGIPVVVDNTAQTTLMIADGETTVIGGLMKFSGSTRKNKVPLLGDIPLLGNLFKSKTRAKSNTELMIFIKPTIIKASNQIPTEPALSRVEEEKKDLTLEDLKKKKKFKSSSDESSFKEPLTQRERNPHIMYRQSRQE